MKIGSALVLIACLLAGGAAESPGAPLVISDDPDGPRTFWGGKAISSVFNEDALGGWSWDIDRMEISFEGSIMTVKVIGRFFTFHPSGADGDLYLSSRGWNVSGSDPHHGEDIFTPEEGWDFVVAPAGLYRLDFDGITMAAGNRTDQAYQGGYGDRVGDAVRVLDWDSSTFIFDTAGLDLGPGFGVHFSPYCGNDIVEGEVPVSEPSTALLLMAGLAGLILHRTRKKICS